MVFLIVHDVLEVVVVSLAVSGGLEILEREFAEGLFIEDVLQMFELHVSTSA